MEYVKRIDPDLPFYYFALAHDRFHERPLPDFDQPRPREKKSSQNPPNPRRDHLGTLITGCASMVTLRALSTRVNFHQVPVDLPPPPGEAIHMVDHSY